MVPFRNFSIALFYQFGLGKVNISPKLYSLVRNEMRRNNCILPIDKIFVLLTFWLGCAVPDSVDLLCAAWRLQTLLLILQKIVEFMNQFLELLVILFFRDLFTQLVHTLSFFWSHVPHRWD